MSEAAEKPRGVQLSAERMYQVIVSPVVTEKATRLNELSQVTFRVSLDATKPEIKAAVERAVRGEGRGGEHVVMKGKTKRFRGREGRRSDWKKAIVKLQAGQTIDLTTGLA
jgi:large subunit ribosomal protein L23